MKLTLYTADYTGDATNCVYPHKAEISNKQELVKAAARDQVFARYKNSYRNISNFLESDVIPMDCDNDHSEKPEDWLSASALEEIFADVDHIIIPSRHHMLEKSGKAARPRYHILFAIPACTDAAMYAAIKSAIQKKYEFFDNNALDAARFFYGAACEPDDITWHEGFLSIDETLDESDYLETEVDKAEQQNPSGGPILEGSRNNTMSRFAGRVLKKYGVCDKAHQVFLQRAEQCDPPLDASELTTIWNSALKFYSQRVQNQEGYIPPEQFNSDFDGEGLKPEDYSDLGEAKVLAREFGNELKYTSATDLLRYDGECWREDKQMALGASLDFMDLQLQDAKDAVEAAEENLLSAGLDEATIKGRGKNLEKACAAMMGLFYKLVGADTYLKFVMKYRNYRNIINVQNTVKPMVALDVSMLDLDPDLLNTPYATYDLSQGITGEQPHDPADLITKITNVAPGDAGKDIWEDALNTFFCGDQKLIDYVQETVGMAAIGKVYQEHMIIAYGGGANGKSTFWNTIFRVLGTYAGKISADTLTMNCKHNTRPEAAELKGKRLIIASEMEEGMRLNTAMVKQLCSTDEIQAEKKYKDPFHFVPSHTLVLYTNHLPKVGANDDGIWRRLIVIPFNAKITGKSDIKNYADYLFEKAGSYIMTWIINGAKKAIDANFHTDLPKIVQEAIDKYRESSDWLGQFIEERCDVDPSYSEKSGELYQQYRFQCVQNGEFVRSTSDFYGALEKAGYVRRKTNKGNRISGLQLKDGQDFLE